GLDKKRGTIRDRSGSEIAGKEDLTIPPGPLRIEARAAGCRIWTWRARLVRRGDARGCYSRARFDFDRFHDQRLSLQSKTELARVRLGKGARHFIGPAQRNGQSGIA